MKRVHQLITTVRAPEDKRFPIPLNQLPDLMLEAHNRLAAMPDSYGEDGEFRLVKASVLENRDVSLIFELGAPGSHLDQTPVGIRPENMLLMLKVLVHRAGGAIDLIQDDLVDVDPNAELIMTELPGGGAWVLRLNTPNRAASRKALPAS